MKLGPRRGKALRLPPTPIALLVGLAVLVAIPSVLLHGASSGARPEESGSRSASPPSAPAAPATAPAPRSEVHALARLAPLAGTITVGARPGARIERIAVEEGDQVAAGALLAVLEGHAQAELQVAQAEAQKRNAEYQRSLGRDRLAVEREREDRLKRDSLDAHQRLVDVARRGLQTSTEIYKKLEKVLQYDEQKRFELDMRKNQAEAEVIKAELALKEAQVGHDLIAKRRAVEDRQLADDGPESDVLDRQIDLARANLDQTMVVAPIAGRVLEVSAHVGEVSTGPLLTMGDVAAMAAVAEVYQSDVPEVRVGDRAEVVILGQGVAGKVTRIGRLVGKNTLASLDPRALQDRRVVAVTIRIDDATTASDYVNMEVEVAIRPKQGGSR